MEDSHDNDKENISANSVKIIDKIWPEGVYNKTKIKVRNPLEDAAEQDTLLVLKKPTDDAYIINKLAEKYPRLKTLLKEDMVRGQTQFLDNITRTRNGEEYGNRVYILCEETTEDRYKALKDLESQIEVSGRTDKIAIIAIEEAVRTSIRKLTEIVFLRSNVEFEVYVPKHEKKYKTAKESKFETVVINSSQSSYADMLRVVRKNIDTEKLGLEVKNMRKLKNDSLLIVTEKGQASKLIKEINENAETNNAGIHVVEKMTEILVTGIDAVTTEEELKSVVSQKLGNLDNKAINLKSMYTNRNGEQVATISIGQELAQKLINEGPITVGWSRCKIKEKVKIPRCTNCLKMGHLANFYNMKKSQQKKYMKCTKEGHSASECDSEISYCISCAKEGHRSDSMKCPRYRRLVYQKEKS